MANIEAIAASIRSIATELDLTTDQVIDQLQIELNRKLDIDELLGSKISNIIFEHFGGVPNVLEFCTEFGFSQIRGVGAGSLKRMNEVFDQFNYSFKEFPVISPDTPLELLGVSKQTLAFWKGRRIYTVKQLLTYSNRGIYTGVISEWGTTYLNNALNQSKQK